MAITFLMCLIVFVYATFSLDAPFCQSLASIAPSKRAVPMVIAM